MLRRLVTLTAAAAVLGAIAAAPAAFAKKGSLSQIDAMRKSNRAAEHPGGSKRKEECKKQASQQGYTSKTSISEFVKSCKNKDAD
jgi:hypothetical protein